MDTQNTALTSDDEQARRLCALAIAFTNAVMPISSTEVHEAYYPELSDDSFRRKFSRDREKLVECGLVVRFAGSNGDVALWQADAVSFADTSAVSAEDALMLDVLCAPLVNDPSFAYRHELRLALAKVDRAFGTLTAARVSSTQRGESSVLQTLLSCLAHGHWADISYTDAQGTKTRRTVAPYGQFGLRGNVYFVCAQHKEGADEPVLRTLRADRVKAARETGEGFSVPEDFCVEDHILLPFQLGAERCRAQLAPLADADADHLFQLGRRATRKPDGTYEVAVSDVDACARWTIAAGLRPLAPEALVTAWHEVLGQAGRAQAAPMPKASRKAAAPAAPKARRGRPGGTSQLRELVALASSLTAEGSTLSPDAVSARLGVSAEHARLLIDLLLTACVGSSYQLPLGLGADEGVVLSRAGGVVGHALRLTQQEHVALVAALDKLGFSAEDQLRADLLAAFAPLGPGQQDLQARIEATLPQDDSQTLEACSRAISSGGALFFAYQGVGAAPSQRSVVPQAVRRSDGLWYLDAFDLDRGALRTFRVDRMQDVRVRAAQAPDLRQSVATPAERQVEVAFASRRALDLLEWPKLRVLGEKDGVVVATLPFYGGIWLPRHLASCGDEAWTSDEELAALVRQVARDA